jgi:hypothetical protein
MRLSAGATAGLILAASACGDLFHGTDWSSRCDSEPGAPGCPAGAGGGVTSGGGMGGDGGGTSSSSGSSAGGGGSCEPGTTSPCYTGPSGTQNVGRCESGIATCKPDGSGPGPCVGEVVPAPEGCATAIDEDCDGSGTNGCLYTSCAAVPDGIPTGLATLSIGGGVTVSTLCDQDTAGGGWALLYNSVGGAGGTTPAFWNIAFADRLDTLGIPQLDENFYAGSLYTVATEYRDEIEDIGGALFQAASVVTAGFDETTMTFLGATQVSGVGDIFSCHYLGGWSSTDHDGDLAPENCAANYLGVSQHYCGCWNINLGSDADTPFEDDNWGPHVGASPAGALGIQGDGTPYTRVNRLVRWARW